MDMIGTRGELRGVAQLLLSSEIGHFKDKIPVWPAGAQELSLDWVGGGVQNFGRKSVF